MSRLCPLFGNFILINLTCDWSLEGVNVHTQGKEDEEQVGGEAAAGG